MKLLLLDGEYKMVFNIGLEETVGVLIGILLKYEAGFFRIQMHKHNLDIENDCTWGVPIITGEQEM
jgi:hypothetical protein